MRMRGGEKKLFRNTQALPKIEEKSSVGWALKIAANQIATYQAVLGVHNCDSQKIKHPILI
jgi:hypothetical protein